MSPIATFRTPKPNPEAGFEWEDLPSLADVVVLRRHVPQASYEIAAELVEQARARLQSEPPVAPVWVETLPAIFDPPLPQTELAATRIEGLAAREITDPDVFRHLFESAIAKAK